MVRFNPGKTLMIGNPEDDRNRQINFDICRAIDIIKLGIVLDQMIDLGLPDATANTFKEMAHNIRDLIRTENNRLHNY